MSESLQQSVKTIAFGVLALAALVYVIHYSRSVDKTFPTRTFSVEGNGEVEMTPDVATFSATVITEGSNVNEVQNQNTEKMNRINDFLKKQGVEEKDLKTAQYNLNPRYNYPVCQPGTTVCPPPSINGYTLNQTLEVKVRDTEKTGDLLSGIVTNGATSVSDIRFVVDDENEAKNEAREEAISMARQKAQAMAKAGGFQIGELVSIYENSNPVMPYYGGMEMSAVKSDAVQNAVPRVQPGTEETSVQVTLMYEIVN